MYIRDLIKQNGLFDSHAHLNFTGYDTDRDKVVKRATDNGIMTIYDIGTDIESSKKSIELAKKFPGVVFSFVGIDPEIFLPGSEIFIGLDKDQIWIDEQYSILKDLIAQNRKFIAGIGESGMDFYQTEQREDGRPQVNIEAQRRGIKLVPVGKASQQDMGEGKRLQEALFRTHLKLASEFKLPLSIHSRSAEKECLQIALQYPEAKGIFHSYTGDYETAVKILDSGWGLGVNGIVTFKNAQRMRELYKRILGNTKALQPEDFYNKGIFFETDSPFLSPEGKRGQRNEPSSIKDIYLKLISI